MAIYMWRECSWTPGANTLGYRPFVSDLNDYSGNNRNFSVARGSVSYSDNMATITNGIIRIGSQFFTGTGDFTIIWYRKYTDNFAFWFWNDNAWYPKAGISVNGGAIIENNNRQSTSPLGDATTNVVRMGTFVRDGSNYYYYQDGVLVGTYAGYGVDITGGPGMQIGGHGGAQNGNGSVGGLVFEDKARTAQEILNYYNSTKSLYGIS